MSAQATRDHTAVAGQVISLRTTPTPATWKQVGRQLGLLDRELSEYRWLIAADLAAQHPEYELSTIAKHPAVAMRRETLSRGKARKKLLSGLTWSEHVEAYRDALAEETARLQAEAGRDAAQRLYRLAEQTLKSLEAQRELIDSYRAFPPDAFKEQLVLAFPDGEALKYRVHWQFAETLSNLDNSLLKSLKLAREVLIGGGDETGDTDEAEATSEELNAIMERVEAKRAELLALADQGAACA